MLISILSKDVNKKKKKKNWATTVAALDGATIPKSTKFRKLNFWVGDSDRDVVLRQSVGGRKEESNNKQNESSQKGRGGGGETTTKSFDDEKEEEEEDVEISLESPFAMDAL